MRASTLSETRGFLRPWLRTAIASLASPEISVAGLLVPWIVTIGALGFLAAWLFAAILERTGLARHVWHLPLCFLALVILFSSLIGAVFFP